MISHPPGPERDREARARSAVGLAMMLGMNLAAGMAFFVGLGYYLDYRRGAGRWGWTIAGTCLGLLYGAYEVYKVVSALNASEPTPRRPSDTLTPRPHA